MEGFGFIHEKLDIKILILFILGRVDGKVDVNTLTDLCLCDGGISYFDYIECLSELTQTEHVSVKDDCYEITEKGRRNGAITESSIPYSVRNKVENKIAVLKQQIQRSEMIKAESIEREGGGYTVTLGMSDGIGEVLSIELFAGDKVQARALCRGFKERAEQIYSSLINEILKE